MLNLWIGLCRGAPGLPTAIRNLGYEDKGIELTFSTADLSKVNPELIVASRALGHTILLEWKGGANTDVDQLKRYAKVQANDLVRAGISAEAAQSHDVALVGLPEHADRLRIGLQGFAFPLLLATADGLVLSQGSFKKLEISACFTPFLPVDFDVIPNSYIPADEESTRAEVAEVIMPAVLVFMNERRPDFTVEEICHATFTLWRRLGRQQREAIKTKARSVLKEAASYEFGEYLAFQPQMNRVEIKHNPAFERVDRRTAAYRKLLAAQANLLRALTQGRQRGTAVQPSLYEPQAEATTDPPSSGA